VHWEKMRAAARKTFTERFVVDRAADSFIRAMRLYGLRSTDTI